VVPQRSLCLALIALAGCWLERTDGVPEPLDPRYYAAVESQAGDPTKGDGRVVPFADHEGPRVVVRVALQGPSVGPIEVDVRVPDPAAEGGVRSVGKVQIAAGDPLELSVPSGQGMLEIQAFQDAALDGPTAEDPFGQLSLNVVEEDITGGEITLEVGAFDAAGPQHTEAPPGAPGGGGGPPGSSGAGAMRDAFPNYTGERVEIHGEVRYAGEGMVDIDLFQPDPTQPGGRRALGKIRQPAGPFTLTVPRNLGALTVEACADLAGDGPTPGSDPTGGFPGNPLTVGDDDIDGVVIELSAPAAPPRAP